MSDSLDKERRIREAIRLPTHEDVRDFLEKTPVDQDLKFPFGGQVYRLNVRKYGEQRGELDYELSLWTKKDEKKIRRKKTGQLDQTQRELKLQMAA